MRPQPRLCPILGGICERGLHAIPDVARNYSGFPKRSLSTRLAQKAACCPERREIMARRDSLDEVPKLLTQCLIGKSTGEGMERPKLQPARLLSAGGLDGTAQRSSGGFGFPAAISQLTVDSLQLGLEIALVAPV